MRGQSLTIVDRSRRSSVARRRAASTTTPAPQIRLRDCVAAVVRRRWLIIGAAVVSVAVAAAYNAVATPVFEAHTRLLIGPDTARIVTFKPVVEENQEDLEYYQTQYEVLRSRMVARRVLNTLSLWDEPGLAPPSVLASLRARVSGRGSGNANTGAAARSSGDADQTRSEESQIDRLLAAISISPVKQSRLVDVRVRSVDPQLAARVADGIAASYIEQNLELKRRSGQDASKWLTARVGELRAEVNSREEALQQYREGHDSLSDRQNIVAQRLGQLDTALTSARTERMAKEAAYAQLRSGQRSGAPLDTFPAIADNPSMQRLKADLVDLRRQRAQLGQQLGSQHPDLLKVDAAIAVAEAGETTEMARISETVRNDVVAAQRRERDLRAALEQQKGAALSVDRQTIGYDALKRDAASAQEMLASVLQRDKEAELSGQLQANNVRLIDPAPVPRAPIWPRPQVNTAVALFFGLFLGLGAAVGLEHLHPRLLTPGDVGESLRLPVLGVTPRIAAGDSAAPAGGSALPAMFLEPLRAIRMQLLLSASAAHLRSIAITSSTMGEGKTMVASSLAMAIAAVGRRVLLIDADLRRPRLHEVFGVANGPGLADLISTPDGAAVTPRESGIKGLWLLTAGVHATNPADLLEGDRLKRLLAKFDDLFDVVVLDCPPVRAVADAAIIANAAASVLFVVGAGTRRDMAEGAIDQIRAAQANVIGVVLNKADFHRHAGDYSLYYQPADAVYYRPTVGSSPSGPR